MAAKSLMVAPLPGWSPGQLEMAESTLAAPQAANVALIAAAAADGVKVLAAPFDRDKAERARSKFTEIQTLIDALDRAIAGENAISPKD